MLRKNKTYFKKEGLHVIRDDKNTAAIVFVHGLRGDPYKTWTKKNHLSLPHLLRKDNRFQSYDIFTFGYKTNVILRQQRYQRISEILYSELHARTKYDEIYFITHSMGGLIVQNLIIDRIESEDSDFINSINGIIYLSVPFYGSIGGSIAKFINSLLPPIIGDRIISVQVNSLSILGEDLEEQSRRWAQYNNRTLAHVKSINIYGLLDRIVKTSSSNPAYIQNSYPVQENHRSICKVDEESTVYNHIGSFLNGLMLQKQGIESELNSYFKWLKEKTKNFIVPGVNIPLNIENAWASIQVLEKSNESSTDKLETKLKKYHEWERLSNSDSLRKDAQDMTQFGKYVVLIGGPGSGKSTLAQRTVNRLVTEKKKTLYVKLSKVSQQVNQGMSFEKALWETAIDGYIEKESLAQAISLSPDVLVADGLDECGPSQREMSSAITEWGKARPNTQIIVTTRPIGYESAYFHDYTHMEILPLNEKEIYRYASRLIKMLLQSDLQDNKYLDQFKRQLKSNRTASVAARSPLLLNFLIQLSVSGQAFGTYRAQLYSKILEEWASPRNSQRGEHLGVNPQIALTALEWIGWHLQLAASEEYERSEKSLVEGLAHFLTAQMDVKYLDARELADNCLKYWTEKGILEHLQVGFEDAYTFIHLTLGEYSAARYFTNMEPQTKQKIFIDIYRSPIWRETLLLAGGEGSARIIVEELLKLEKDKHDIFNDIVLAAAVLAETSPIESLNKQVLERLTLTICSPIPMLAYEAGEAAEGIAMQEPEWILSLAEPLLNHEQLWTRLVSTCLCLKAGKQIFNVNTYIEFLSQAPKAILGLKSSQLSNDLLWNKSILLGLKQLLDTKLSKEELVKIAVSLSEKRFSARAWIEIREIYKSTEAKDGLEILDSEVHSGFNKYGFSKYNFESANKRIKDEEIVILEAILNVIPSNNSANYESDLALVELAKVFEGLKIWEQPIGDFSSIAEGININSARTVLKEMIAVLEIDTKKLYHEISSVLNREQDVINIIFQEMPNVPSSRPNWKKVNSSQINFKYLVEALGHPSHTIATNAKLLIQHIDDENLGTLINELIISANDQELYYISLTLPNFHKKETVSLILERLCGEHSKGLKYLYEILVKLPETDNNNSVHEVLLRGITSPDNELAKYAAEAMLKSKQSYNQTQLHDILSSWDENGVSCETCSIMVKERSCPECHVVPPTPIPELLELAFFNDFLTFDRWLHFAMHVRDDVRQKAIKGLAKCLTLNQGLFTEFINEIREETKPTHLLNTVFEVDKNLLSSNKESIFRLIESPSFSVRKRLVKELAKGTWLSKEEALQITKLALEDKHEVVKNEAVLTIRSLNNHFKTK